MQVHVKVRKNFRNLIRKNRLIRNFTGNPGGLVDILRGFTARSIKRKKREGKKIEHFQSDMPVLSLAS